MANFYLRVPHYVAAYFRNRDSNNPIPLGGMMKFDKLSPIWKFLSHMLKSNTTEFIVPFGCFCERQWRRMLRGSTIYTTLDGRRKQIFTGPKATGEILNDAEIFKLAGVSPVNGEEHGEYICIQMPPEVYVNNRMCKTNGQWQLMEGGAKILYDMMSDEFWSAFFTYIKKDYEWCVENGIDRPVLETIDRFMTRYDIRNSSDDKERMALKRNYYRKRKKLSYADSEFIEHG